MPKGSYKNKFVAKKNAKLIINKTKCDAIKIESNKKILILLMKWSNLKFQ